MSTTEETKPSDNPEEAGKEKEGSWKDAIYNPATGELFGRTGKSWGLILLFYLVFYSFLAGMFALTMWVMLLTLPDNQPKYSDRVSTPGLVIRPKAVEIIFNKSDNRTYQKYIQNLDNFLKQYDDDKQEKNELCTPGEFFTQEPVEGEEPGAQKKVCQFKRSLLNVCSGIYDPTFGYAEGQPCIIIKMNRIIGLLPKGQPIINCTTKTDDAVGMRFYPDSGVIDKMYFPYYGKNLHTGYTQPIVAVKLAQAVGSDVTLECRIEGTQFKNNDERDKALGRVTFRVKISE